MIVRKIVKKTFLSKSIHSVSPLVARDGHKLIYEIWYTPRIQDELVVARFDNINDTYDHMDKIRIERPKAYQHHYIWDPEKKEKVKHRSI